MSRELKFRVWDYELKKMRYLNTNHDFICFDPCGNGYYENMQTGPGEWFSGLMQYTGLKDKNGEEVYEGDILDNTAVNFKFVVKFENTKYILQKLDYPKDKLDMSDYFNRIPKMFEVIGNIYEREVTNAKD